MYRTPAKSPNLSIRTDYSQKRKRKRNKINRIDSPEYEFDNKNNYNLTTKNFNKLNNRIHYEEIQKYPKIIRDPWSTFLSKTSNEGQNKIISPQKYKDNNVLSNNPYHNMGEKRHFKESFNYDYTTKTQITTLPGGIKRNRYEIKDDMYFRKPYNESRLYKMIHDFNCNINYEQDYDPVTQGYSVNCFPTKERYYGSYKRGIKDHDIFNTNYYNYDEKGFNYRFYGK
jgi:hypothetical protein